MKVLAINPGSTSTKTALYSEEGEIAGLSVSHDSGELATFATIIDQLEFRTAAIRTGLEGAGQKPSGLDAVVGRGGLLHPLAGGVYAVNEAMKEDLRSCRYGSHASNLGALIAEAIAREQGIPAYIVDPVVVDELDVLARYSGIPEISRRSIFHALNQKATARKAASALGKEYNSCTLIVAHMGGGTSVGIHHQGRVVDVNNALDGDGPFAIERAGSLPVGDWMRYVLAHHQDPVALQRKLTGKGGVVAYLGSNDARAIDEAITRHLEGGKDSAGLEGRKCLEVILAMCYQIAKEISALASVVRGEVDAVVLTGGLAHNRRIVEEITARVSFLAPVLVFPGENELQALATAVIAVLQGRETAKEYKS